MKLPTFVTCLAAIALFMPLAACDEAAEEIELTLAELENAAASRNGEGFARGLAPESFQHYDRLIKFALDGKYEQVLKLPHEERLDILIMRNRSTRKELSKMDGRAWVVHFVNQGWHEGVLPPEEYVDRKIITSRGNTASMEIIYDLRQPIFTGAGSGDKLSDTMTFQRVEDRWLVDARRPSVLFERYIEVERRISHLSPNQILEGMETATTGKVVDKMIWETPMR